METSVEQIREEHQKACAEKRAEQTRKLKGALAEARIDK